MSTRTTLDSDQVLAIASQIENDNKELQRLLNESKTTLDGLSSTWTGAAAEQTRASYGTFAGKFFQEYYDVLDQYVKFLRSNVVEQYSETESKNVQLGDQFM